MLPGHRLDGGGHGPVRARAADRECTPMRRRTLIGFVLALLLLALLAQLAYWLGVRRYFQGVADALAPVAELEHGGIDAFPPGRFALRDLRFTVRGRPELSLSARRLAVTADDAGWLLRWLAGASGRPPARLGLVLDEVRASPGLRRALRAKAAGGGWMLPFEGQGCAADGLLGEADYADLRWLDESIALVLQHRHDPVARQQHIGLRVDRLPAGVLTLDLLLAEVPQAGVPATADLGGARVERAQFGFDPGGLVQARNRHCAAGGEVDAFVEAHMEALHGWLGGHGLVPDEPVWQAYRNWVIDGGELQLEMRPAPGVAMSEYGQFAPEDRLRLLGLVMRVGDAATVPVEATGTRGRAAHPYRDLPSLPAEPVVDDAQVATGAPEAAVEPAPARPATAPARVPAPRPLGFEELDRHIGARVRLATVGGNRYVGTVLAVTADAVELEIRRYGGRARLPVPREQLARIELLPPAP